MASIKAYQSDLLQFIEISQARAQVAHHAKFIYKHCKFQHKKAFVTDRYYSYASLQAESVSTQMQATGWMWAAGFCSRFEDLERFVFLLSFVVVVVLFVVLSLFVAVVLERLSVLVFVCLLGFEIFWIAGWGFIWLVLLFLSNSIPTLFLISFKW